MIPMSGRVSWAADALVCPKFGGDFAEALADRGSESWLPACQNLAFDRNVVYISTQIRDMKT